MATRDRALTKERDRFLEDIQIIAGLGTYVLDIASGRWESSSILNDIFGIDDTYERSIESWAALIHPEDRDMMVNYFVGEVVGRRQPFRKEYRIVRRKDGGERWVQGRGRLELEAQGQPLKMIGTIQDITSRKLTEESLRNSESRYRELIELAVDGILLGTQEGVIIDANRRICELSGIAREDLMGRDIRALSFDPASLERMPFRFDLLQAGQTVVSERTLIRPDGTRIEVEMRTRMMPDGIYQSIFRDVTERRRIEETVWESQRALSTLLGNLQGMAYRCKNDENWTMEFFSAGVKELTGYDAGDFINNAKLSYASVIHPDDRQYVYDEVQSALLEHRHFQLIYRIVTAAGVEKWVWEKGIGVYSSTGSLLAIEGFIADITERKQAEDDLRRLADTLEQRVAERTRELEAAHAALQRSHALLSETGRVAHVGGWELDLQTLQQIWTDEMYRINEVDRGFKPTLDNGRNFYAPESRPIIDQAVKRAMERGDPFDDEMEIITAKGNRRWVRTVGWLDPGRRKLLGILQDITASKQAALDLVMNNEVLDRSVVQLRSLAAELTQAEERERKRLAGMLHDNLQPLLVASTIKVSLLDRKASEQEHARAVQEILDILGETLEASRALTTHLYPPVLLDAGLVPGLRWLADWMRAKHNLAVKLEMDESLEIPETLCILLFRVVRELLLNVVKHAKVASATVEMVQEEIGALRITVRDAGCGFDINASATFSANDGLGLFHLREHLAATGGSLAVSSMPGRGTEVSVTVPFLSLTGGGQDDRMDRIQSEEKGRPL